MLFTEFLEGTKAHDNAATYEQYTILEKIYMACEHTTKEDIYRIWKQTYGRQAKIEHDRTLKLVQAMSEYRDTDDALTPERARIRRSLFQTGASLTGMNEFHAGWTVKTTTPDGVTYSLERYDVINGHAQSRLWIEFDGKRYGTALIYSFGDLRIHGTPDRLPWPAPGL